MASITSWLRLEPRTLDAELAPGLEARLHDPLWSLARQWQLGELAGEDCGSAIMARTRWVLGRVHAITAGQQRIEYDGVTPLPAIVEASGRDAAPLPDLAARARAGRQLIRTLAASAAGAFTSAFPLEIAAADEPLLDQRDRDFLALVRGRVPDGFATAVALRTSLPGLPANVAHVADPAVIDACTRWLAWFDRVERPAFPSWRGDHLEHAFSLVASHGGRELQCAADEHHGGDLGWWSFEARDAGASPRAQETDVATAIPAPVRYRGMAAHRYWDLEDAAVDWGAIDAAPNDIARMLLVEFALAFGDDWLVVPIACDYATLVEIRSLVVTDVFGVKTLVRPAPAGSWRGFTVSGSNALFVLPRAPYLESRTIERVRFTRSELSNLAWGVEESAARADGTSRDLSPAPPRSSPSAEPRYVLGPPVPSTWHPYRASTETHGVRLARAVIPGSVRIPMTAVVEQARSLAEAELGAGDPCIETKFRLARDANGRYHLWRARHRTQQAPATPVTVRFDDITEGER